MRYRDCRLKIEIDKPKRQKSKCDPIAFVHIDIAKVRTSESDYYLSVATDQTRKYAIAQLVDTEN